MANNNPEKRFTRGGCCVSIFVNEIERDGQKIGIRKAVFQKRYKDKQGEWQSTSSLDINDIPRAILCMSEAFAYLTQPDAIEKED